MSVSGECFLVLIFWKGSGWGFCEGLFFIKVLSEKLKVPTEILKRAKK